MNNVVILGNSNGKTHKEPPKKLIYASDYALRAALSDLTRDFGTIGAYERLCDLASILKKKIEAGESEPPCPYFLKNPAIVK
jgi:hypothetical protein